MPELPEVDACQVFQVFFETLFECYGPQYWWPAETLTELCVGAILTQNVSWRNAEQALERLRERDLLNIEALSTARPHVLAAAIEPAGYYNVKTRRLKALARHVSECHGGDPGRLLNPARPRNELRRELLNIYGVGPETADALLVYGARHPAFIADAYGRRILGRSGLIAEDSSYEEARRLVEAKWQPRRPASYPQRSVDTVDLWGEFHGLLVRLGKERCTKTGPSCASCPVQQMCRRGNGGAASN